MFKTFIYFSCKVPTLKSWSYQKYLLLWNFTDAVLLCNGLELATFSIFANQLNLVDRYYEDYYWSYRVIWPNWLKRIFYLRYRWHRLCSRRIFNGIWRMIILNFMKSFEQKLWRKFFATSNFIKNNSLALRWMFKFNSFSKKLII